MGSITREINKNSRRDLVSRFVITSSIISQVSDGIPGQGGPFINSLVRVLIKNSNSEISTNELIKQTEIELAENYSELRMVPGIGVLRNSSHQGGEFSFQLKEEFTTPPEGKETKVLEKSLFDSMKRLEKEFLSNLESNQKKYEETIRDLRSSETTTEAKLNKKKLIRFLKDDKIKNYFDELDIVQDLIDSELVKELIILQSRWNASENQRRIGIISLEKELLEKNNIRNGLVEITTKIH